MKEFKETPLANKVFEYTPHLLTHRQQGEAGLLSSVDGICLVKAWVQSPTLHKPGGVVKVPGYSFFAADVFIFQAIKHLEKFRVHVRSWHPCKQVNEMPWLRKSHVTAGILKSYYKRRPSPGLYAQTDTTLPTSPLTPAKGWWCML